MARPWGLKSKEWRTGKNSKIMQFHVAPNPIEWSVTMPLISPWSPIAITVTAPKKLN
jgi:hypothetical protein